MGACVSRDRGDLPAVPGVELVLTVVAAGFEGASVANCRVSIVGMAVTNAAALLISVLVRPYTVPGKNALLILGNALTFAATAAAAAVIIATTSESRDESLRTAAASLAAAAALLSNISLGLLAARLFLLHVGGVRMVVDTSGLQRCLHAEDEELIELAQKRLDGDGDGGGEAPVHAPLLVVADRHRHDDDFIGGLLSGTPESDPTLAAPDPFDLDDLLGDALPPPSAADIDDEARAAAEVGIHARCRPTRCCSNG
jgi:hypothetical protein